MRWTLLVALAASVQAYSFQYPLMAGEKTAALPRPSLPKPPIMLDLTDQTIAEILNKSLHEGHPSKPPPHFPPPGPPHVLPLHRLAWLLNISTADDLKAQLADPKANLSFIAPDDDALRPPPPPPRHDGPHGPPPRRGPVEPRNPREHPLHSCHVLHTLQDDNNEPAPLKDSGDDEDKEKKKELFKKLVGFVLKYHLLDGGAYHPHELADFSTVGTSLADTRIHVENRLFPTPSLIFNFYSKTRNVVVKAKNGFIYLVDAPLLPPLTPLSELFILPTIFSTLTSGVQKVGLDLHTWHFEDKDLADDDVHPVVMQTLNELVKELPPAQTYTVFAPTNGAFKRLGWHLNAFLFSPFTNRILKAILSYHVVPDVVFYSDFNVNATATGSESSTLPADSDELPEELLEAGLVVEKPQGSWFRRQLARPGPGEVKVTHYSLKTLFNERSLPVDVYEFRKGLFGRGPLERAIWVGTGEGGKPGSRVKVVAKDIPALKGSIQVVASLIRPPFPEHHHDHEGGTEFRDFHRASRHWH